jgi:hypothetical protein
MKRVRYAMITSMLALLAACDARPTTEVTSRTNRPQSAHVPDLDGTPDLIVDAAKLGSSWVMYNENIPPGCTAEEGEVTPGEHRTLRFTVSTPNIGTADVYIGDPNKHFDPNGDGNPADSDGLYELATCHNHLHFRNYAKYELIPVQPDGSLGTPVTAAKRGFCMIDIAPYGSDETSPKAWVYRSCGRPAIGAFPEIPGNQGIATGYADVYTKWLAGQFFVVDNVPAGPYVIRITVNPPFTPQNGEVCPHTDGLGFCHMLKELTYANNVGEVRITIPAGRAGKKGWGPNSGEELPANLYDNDADKQKVHQHK